MAQKSTIEWTEATWNPVTGCTKISEGCQHCYAERMAKRLYAMGQERYKNNFAVTLHEDLIDRPKEWRKPRTVFVNSMSDLFHQRVPIEFIQAVFRTMEETPWHTYQVLTKRARRLLQLSSHLPWSKNIWMGVSVENQDHVDRVAALSNTTAFVKFLSLEPLLGPIDSLPLDGIDWVIVGGESGPRSRPMEKSWVRGIRDTCLNNGVPFFFKQWGGTRKALNGRVLDGKVWNQYPTGS